MKEQNRLFVPMGKEAFLDFRDNGKEVELRKYGRNFTERTVFLGRRVELRLGYSGSESMWGTIGQVVVGSFSEVFSSFELLRVEPRFATIEDAIADNLKLLGVTNKVIAFEVLKLYVSKNS